MVYDESIGDDECAKETFVASHGWLEKFMRRNGLYLRQRTTTTEKDPACLVNKLAAYVLEVHRLSEKHLYTSQSIIAMDEMAVWADMVSQSTVDKVGKREI